MNAYHALGTEDYSILGHLVNRPGMGTPLFPVGSGFRNRRPACLPIPSQSAPAPGGLISAPHPTTCRRRHLRSARSAHCSSFVIHSFSVRLSPPQCCCSQILLGFANTALPQGLSPLWRPETLLFVAFLRCNPLVGLPRPSKPPATSSFSETLTGFLRS